MKLWRACFSTESEPEGVFINEFVLDQFLRIQVEVNITRNGKNLAKKRMVCRRSNVWDLYGKVLGQYSHY